MRNTFAQEITRLSIKNKKIVLLAGDIGNKLFNKFKDKSKNRFFNCGVAEANMSTVAAGLAYSGLIPITYTIASFNTYKIVYNNTSEFPLSVAGSVWFDVSSEATYGYNKAFPAGSYSAVVTAECIAQ